MGEAERISPTDRATLLQAARRTLEEYLVHQRRPVIEVQSSTLLDPCGAFVTLHRGRDLRGCIGTFEATAPVIDTVQRMAIAAATTDPRFPRVSAEELPDLHIEISVLSPLTEAPPESVRVGLHGIYITRGHHRGVLLPQVAAEQGWDRETFLEHTCLKAGLPRTAWRDPGTRIEVFTADVFSEPEGAVAES